MPLGRDYGRGVALVTIVRKKSDLVHVPPGLVHVGGGVGKVDFFLVPTFNFSSHGRFRTPQGVP